MSWLRRIEPFARPFWQRWSTLSRGLSLGVRGMVVDQEGRVLLIEHTYIPGWFMPGGGVERNETAEDAVVRELREEAGVEAIGRPRLLSVHDNRSLFPGDHVLLYRIDAWRPCERASGGEILNVGWFALESLPQGTSQKTRRRLTEIAEGLEPDPMW
jgi:ADP-ribose pyrophosphatase YjhB (NUDIX family)